MARSKRIVFVSHSLLNQNVMPLGTEKYPGAVKELLELLNESEVGIVQLPAIEVDYNGGINSKPKPKTFYENKTFRDQCRRVSQDTIKQIENYLKENYKVLGILGVEFSPIYGVNKIENGRKFTPGKGVFIEELETEMQKKNFQVPIIGIDLNNIYSSITRVQSLLNFA